MFPLRMYDLECIEGWSHCHYWIHVTLPFFDRCTNHLLKCSGLFEICVDGTSVIFHSDPSYSRNLSDLMLLCWPGVGIEFFDYFLIEFHFKLCQNVSFFLCDGSLKLFILLGLYVHFLLRDQASRLKVCISFLFGLGHEVSCPKAP